MEDDEPLEESESLLYNVKECYVYQIPPLKSESGHRANDWDVNKWLWSGKLVVVAKGELLTVRLEDAQNGELFAACPMPSQDCKASASPRELNPVPSRPPASPPLPSDARRTARVAVDPVVDSSRYFVLRIDDGQGKHAFIGLGFRDRSESYDFNATLQDHWKGIARQREADAIRAEMEARRAPGTRPRWKRGRALRPRAHRARLPVLARRRGTRRSQSATSASRKGRS